MGRKASSAGASAKMAATEPAGDVASARTGAGGHNHSHGDGRHAPAGLTRNEKLVWDALADGGEPLKAYEILDMLKDKGVRAPMTIYRALDGLEEKGVIHKLDGLNSFMRCNHDAPHQMQAFLVCESCSTVTEIAVDPATSGVAPAARRAGFSMQTARLEVRGVCVACSAA